MVFSIIKKSQLEGAHRIDAEYFQPAYLEIERTLAKSIQHKKWGELEGRFITGPFGSEFIVDNYTTVSKFRYVRGKDVKEFFLEDDDNVYIPEQDFNRLKKYSLQQRDILISVVGTNGNTVIIDKSVPPAIFSSKSTVFRTTAINPFYFIAFLSSKYGQQQLERSVRGALQTGLNVDDLKSVLVYLPKPKTQEEVAHMVEGAKSENDLSLGLYRQAESLLLEKLGLKDDSIRDNLSFVVKLSDTTETHRLDAEYFQPKYQQIREIIEKQRHEKLFNVYENVPAQFLPDNEKAYRYVELADINASIGVIDGYSEIFGKEAPSRARRILKVGDVIASSVEGSLEKSALVNSEQKNFLASTGFFQFRAKTMTPEVFLVIVKSPILQMQLQQRTTGTILSAVSEKSLEDVIIPILPPAVADKVTNLVRQSHAARKKAKGLLEEAEKKVEKMIEKGTSNGS